MKWNADANREGVDLYATVGASAWPMAGRPASHRAEFFCALLPARDDVASPLAALGLYAAREAVGVDHGHTVPADEPLWPGSAMNAFLVVRPRSGFLPALELPDLHIEFLQAIPIFESERAFKIERGAEALLDHWERVGLRFWDPLRTADPA